MGRQTFADTLSDPITTAFGTITATTETVLIPTQYTPIAANEPRAGKVYELWVGGTVTTGTAGTLIITPRLGLTISGTSLTASPTQNYVPSITTTPFLFHSFLVFKSIGLGASSSTCLATSKWESGGAVGTAASQTSVQQTSTGSGAVTVDTSVATALWIGVTFSVAPSIIPQWHIWRSLN